MTVAEPRDLFGDGITRSTRSLLGLLGAYVFKKLLVRITSKQPGHSHFQIAMLNCSRGSERVCFFCVCDQRLRQLNADLWPSSASKLAASFLR